MKTQTISLALTVILTAEIAKTQFAEEWSATYNGPGNGVDIPAVFAVDRHGNLYIAGRSSGINTGQDIAVIKYSDKGDLLLELRYNGPTSGWDEVADIAVDDSGNIYVTGTSSFSSSETNIVTIKYTQAGDIQWLRSFLPSAAISTGARGLAIDDSGNVYVGGVTWRTYARMPDLTTIKYSRSGNLEWASTFYHDTSLAGKYIDLAVDRNGNVYAVGSISPSVCPEGICMFDMVTLKYDPAGNQEWVRYYSRSDFSNDNPAFATLQHDGDVTLVGSSSAGSEDVVLIRYSPAGAERWIRVFDGPGMSYDSPRGLAVDAEDNTIFSATSWNGNEAFNIAVAKFSPAGQQLWASEFNGIGDTRDFAGGVTVDSVGSVYVTGSSTVGFTYFYKCVLVKFSSTGIPLFSVTRESPDGSNSQGFAVGLGLGSRVCIGASHSNTQTGSNFLTVQYLQEPLDIGLASLLPVGFLLYQNYPNPFNPTTNIEFRIANFGFVSLKVYDVLGREVATLVNEVKPPGAYAVQFDARQTNGGQASNLASGIYFYRLLAGNFVQTRKMAVMR